MILFRSRPHLQTTGKSRPLPLFTQQGRQHPTLSSRLETIWLHLRDSARTPRLPLRPQHNPRCLGPSARPPLTPRPPRGVHPDSPRVNQTPLLLSGGGGDLLTPASLRVT